MSPLVLAQKQNGQWNIANSVTCNMDITIMSEVQGEGVSNGKPISQFLWFECISKTEDFSPIKKPGGGGGGLSVQTIAMSSGYKFAELANAFQAIPGNKLIAQFNNSREIGVVITTPNLAKTYNGIITSAICVGNELVLNGYFNGTSGTEIVLQSGSLSISGASDTVLILSGESLDSAMIPIDTEISAFIKEYSLTVYYQ